MSYLVGRPIFAGMNKWSTFVGRMTHVKRITVKKTVAHLSCRVPLLHFPSRLIYVAGCRYWRLQKYVDLNPEGREIKGTLNYHDHWTLEFELTEIGEALVAKDGLIHPNNPCKYMSSCK